MSHTQQDLIRELAEKHSLIQTSTLEQAGVSSTAISRATRNGTLERISRGLYQRPGAEVDENMSLSEVAARVPKSVIVLFSALQFHSIGTQQPHSIWILLKQNAVKPRLDYPTITVVRSTIDEAFTEGVEIHELNGIATAITNPARTVADCFKYRNKIGLDVCTEALRDVLAKGIKPSKIMRYARIQRVAKVIQPYIESHI